MIIAFTGKKGSGKTTASNYFIDKGFKKVSFKDSLIVEMKELLPDVLTELANIYNRSIDELFETKPPAMRKLMQNYGTEVRRKDDKDYWVKKWIESTKGVDNIVVDDVRFLNEAYAVRSVGGIIVRLSGGQEGDAHESETEMDTIVPNYILEVKFGDHQNLFKGLESIYEDTKKD